MDETERDLTINRLVELLEVAYERDQDHFQYICDHIEEIL